jgi:hypothetical protein
LLLQASFLEAFGPLAFPERICDALRGQRPFLVGALAVKLSAALDQFTGSPDAPERR